MKKNSTAQFFNQGYFSIPVSSRKHTVLTGFPMFFSIFNLCWWIIILPLEPSF